MRVRLRLTKRSEYGIIAMKYIASMENGEASIARFIAERFNLPQEILAKITQKLVKKS